MDGVGIAFLFGMIYYISFGIINLILTNQPGVVEVFPFVVPCTFGLWDSS